MHKEVMSQTRTGFTEVYARSLSADRDLDLLTLTCDMVLVHDTLSDQDNYLCQIIFKSHFA